MQKVPIYEALARAFAAEVDEPADGADFAIDPGRRRTMTRGHHTISAG
jgi:hypothetical protein